VLKQVADISNKEVKMFNNLKVWRNGSMIPWNSATVPILSHGFSRGSAIFEIFGIHPGTDGAYAFRMDKHLDRLFRTAELLGMRIGPSRVALEEAVAQTVRENGIRRGLVKMMAYWGEVAVISLLLDAKLDVAIFGIPDFKDLGLDQCNPIDVCFSNWRKIRPDMIPSEAKACANYLSGYLARKDAKDRGYNLGILLNDRGEVAEGSTESVFMVKDGVLKTPPMGNILGSITRMSILQAAHSYDIQVSEERITPEMLLNADEIFTCHTGIKVWPVKRLEERHMVPAPGPMTTGIMEMIQAILSMKDKRFASWFQPMFQE
jgi:branched-chain amino acid aminotransferase